MILFCCHEKLIKSVQVLYICTHSCCQLLSPFVDGRVNNFLLQTAIDVNNYKVLFHLIGVIKLTPVLSKPEIA